MAANRAPTFTVGDGKVTVDFPGHLDAVSDLFIDQHARIVLAGIALEDSRSFALARLNADGSLDPAFDTDGRVTTSLDGSGDNIADAATQQDDGRILVAGRDFFGNALIARYNAAGSLDTTFDGDGYAVVDDHGGARGIVVQDDGKVVVAVESGEAGSDGSRTALVRLMPAGALDTSFGGDGSQYYDAVLFPVDLALQSDGKFVVAGQFFQLARLNADGTPDSSFGTGGSVTTPMGPFDDFLRHVVIQADGKILVVGSTQISLTKHAVALLRYNTDGTLDTTFDDDGRVVTTLPGNFSSTHGADVAVAPDGTIYVAGVVNIEDRNDFTLLRYTSSGQLVRMVTTDFGPRSDAATAIGLQPDGRVVVGGWTVDAFAVARYTPDGSLDPAFDPVTVNTLGGSRLYWFGGAPVVLDSDVRAYDPDLGDIGNYAGASLRLARHGGANAHDVFTATGNLGPLAQGGSLVHDGAAVGIVDINSGGTLAVTFNASATQRTVDGVLSSIAYSNGGAVERGVVEIDWTFSDGNIGAQGDGGAQAVTGSTTVRLEVPLIGAASADVLNGTATEDQITGLGGDDTIFGAGGDDTLRGGSTTTSFNMDGALARLADFNGDGFADILQTEADGAMRVWRSTGEAFGIGKWWGVGSRPSDQVADVNGDGRADIVELHESGRMFVWTAAASGDGFNPYTQWGTGSRPQDKLADVNGDAKADVIELHENGNIYVWTSAIGAGFNSYKVWGSGSRPQDQLADVNGDRRADVVELHESGRIYVWLSTGTGFGAYTQWGTGSRPQDKLADLNGDGRADVVQLHENGNIYVWTSTGAGLNAYEVWGHGARPQDQLADVNGDGRTDVVQLHENGNIYVWTATDTGLNPYEVWGHGARPQDQLADVNADGMADVVELHENGNAYVWLSTGTGFAPYSVFGTGAPDSAGNDTFVFGPSFGRDTVRDFTPGSAGGDVLQFDDVFTSFSDVMSHATQNGDNTLITSGNNSIVLEGVLRSLLTPEDMSFV